MVDGHYRRRCYTAHLAAVTAALLWGTASGGAQRVDSSVRRASGEPPHAVLAIGDVSTNEQQHDCISHALSVIERLGLQDSLFSTVIRTDTQLVTKGAIAAVTGTLTYYKNLDDFDAVILFVEGNPPLTSQQKSDLLNFVKSGKGLVALHTTVTAFDSWPEFHRLLGIRSGAATQSEGPEQDVTSSATSRFFPEPFHLRDRIVPLSVDHGTRVLAMANGTPAVWTGSYGRGRVFVSQLGHDDDTWDHGDVQRMIQQAMRWVLRAPVFHAIDSEHTEGGDAPEGHCYSGVAQDRRGGLKIRRRLQTCPTQTRRTVRDFARNILAEELCKHSTRNWSKISTTT